MTPLRQRMIEDMCLRNFAGTTQRSYIHYVAEFAKYFNRSPQELDLEAVRQYQLYLTQERKLSPQSINTFVSAVQFLYLVTLEMPWDKHDFPRARLEEKLPVVLAPDEIQRFLDHVSGVKNRAVLLTCYGSGLRISEAVALKPSDIDSKRKLIRVEHGKGGKDRYAMLSPCLLEVLRAYYRILRPCRRVAVPLLAPAPASDGRRRANRLPRSLATKRPGQTRHSAYASSQLRHASVRARCGYARDSGLAGPQPHRYHRAVYCRFANHRRRYGQSAGSTAPTGQVQVRQDQAF